MSDLAISINNVSKCYKRYGHPVDRLKEILLPGKSRAQEFWALQGIDLEVLKGETLGIIGQNGSGKSTLLQIIAGTLTPTEGKVQVSGRISALLELGSGFNPEFTGRQNVLFNGQLLGLDQKEIEDKFDDVAALADIGDFLEQPVKTYSSGMFVRLAFAVAVSVNPDILIVDEALAVGDIYFQQKCFERIRNLRDLGTTILFVSHDTTIVYGVCNRAVLMESGKIMLDSNSRQVIDLYEAKLLKKSDTRPDLLEIKILPNTNTPAHQDREFSSDNVRTKTLSKAETPASQTKIYVEDNEKEVVINLPEVSIKFVKFLDEDNNEIESVVSDQLVQLCIGVLLLDSFDDLHVGFKVRDKTGASFFETNTFCMGEKIGRVVRGTLLETRFKFCVPLMEGEYTVTVGIADKGFGQWLFERTLFHGHNLTVLKVLKNKNAILWWGLVNLKPSVSIYRQNKI